MIATGRIRIRPFAGVLASETGQHRSGFIVSGTDRIGRHNSIFVFTREAAEATKRHLITGEGSVVFGEPEPCGDRHPVTAGAGSWDTGTCVRVAGHDGDHDYEVL